jgi:hypothetical protein
MISARQIATWIPVSTEMLEDAVELGRWIGLRLRGFEGLVPCQRCHRRVRCVYTIPPEPGDYFRRTAQYFGSTCYRIVMEGQRG